MSGGIQGPVCTWRDTVRTPYKDFPPTGEQIRSFQIHIKLEISEERHSLAVETLGCNFDQVQNRKSTSVSV